jgi:hypothetical protein
LVATLPVSVPVLNTNTNPCPAFNGNGCTLGHESITLDGTQLGPFPPNPLAAPGAVGSLPPTGQSVPLAAGLPNQNPPRLSGSSGDRANENNCESTGGVYGSCPGPVTPGAVVFYMPAGSCLSTGSGGDTYVFSGYQYNWLAVYSPPANGCALNLGGHGNSAYVGLVYAPAATVSVPSFYSFEAAAVGGLIGRLVTFSGTMPTIRFNSGYAPIPPASRLTG